MEEKNNMLNNAYGECYITNGEAYPVCKGSGEEKCHDCCLFENYEEYHSPY